MQITFIWIGKSKFSSYVKLQKRYTERLQHYCRYKIIEIKEPKTKKLQTSAKILNEEELLLSHIDSTDYVVACDEHGAQLSSTQFAQFFQKHQNQATRKIVFVIGGAYGLGDNIKKRANTILSLSSMTMTHDMVRILLLEQVYRAFTILRGEKYHNE